jgi:hypothetical protein
MDVARSKNDFSHFDVVSGNKELIFSWNDGKVILRLSLVNVQDERSALVIYF